MKTDSPRRSAYPRRLLRAVVVVAAAVTAGSGARAGTAVVPGQDPQVTSITLAPPAALPAAPLSLDAAQVEWWVTDWFRAHLGDPATGAPGAAVAVVQGDRVLVARGYGVADLATRRPVTAETVFRVGSVTKPFTATAIMQLVEAGLVEAPAPVNRYLHDLQVPVAFGRPVTVHHLVTHTAGFDVRLEGTAAPADADLQSLGAYLRASLPPQVRRSGEILSYSNHGYTLLGHLVEEVSGESFEKYLAEHVFQPLGMRHSSCRLRPDVGRMAATGYERGASGFRPSAPIHPRVYPAAGLNTTANDMARFIVAHLNGGRFQDARILSEASVAEMQRQQFAQSPVMPGVAFGFFEEVTRGERALVHGGGIRGFMSGLCLWPHYRLGLFISNNGYSGALVQSFVAAFVQRYFPRPPAATTTRERGRRLPLDAFEGAYRAAAATRHTFEKAAELFGGDLEVRAVGGWRPHLDIWGDRFMPSGALEFTVDRGEERLAFHQDAAHGIGLLVTDNPVLGCEVFEKLKWYETSRWHRELLALFVALFASAVLAPFGNWLRPRLAGLPHGMTAWLWNTSHEGRAARALLVAVAALNLMSLALMIAVFRLSRDTGVLYGLPPLGRAGLALSAGTALLALGLLPGAWRAWRRHYWSTPARVHYTLCTAAALGFIAFLRYWELLGY